MNRPRKRLGVLVSFSGSGGVERMFVNLLAALAERSDVEPVLLTLRAEGPHFADLPPNVKVWPLGCRHSLQSVPKLARVLKKGNFDALLAAKDRAGRAAILARRMAGLDLPVFISLGTNLSAALLKRGALSRWWRTAPMPWFYRQTAGVIAVSEGVRQDTLGLTGLPPSRVSAVPNPVIHNRLLEQAAEPSPHPWLEAGQPPVLLGVGRFSRQKDFFTLVRAFSASEASSSARLIILGDGGDREGLEALVAELGLEKRVAFPGFQPNPYAWLQRASLFVLSSRWEGSPTVLTEALALGIPVVSTRCPSGPNETLQEGKYGELTPMEDPIALAAAIDRTLADPLPSKVLQEAVKPFWAENSAEQHLEVIFGFSRTDN